MKNLIKLIILIILVASCASIPAGDTSQTSLDWPGTYKCDKMTLTLRANNTYKAQIGDVEVRSSFRWDRKGRTICLDHLKAEAPCKKFLVGENALIPLKNSGKRLKDGKPLIKVKASK